jgi:predicted lipid-binding transport protein (Tim44 family)
MIARKWLEDKRYASKAWFTIIALSLFKHHFSDIKDHWANAESKALAYLDNLKLTSHLEELFEEAETRMT